MLASASRARSIGPNSASVGRDVHAVGRACAAVTWRGAFIGMFWGLVTGFVAGWFLAFVRNFVITVTIFTVRAKAELAQTSDFLDHI